IEAPTLAAMARRVQEHPFPSLRDARPGLRDEVYRLCERCVATDPKQRLVDARAVLQVLRPLVLIDEAALADAESFVKRTNESLVSPPPRQTLMTIRAEVESGVLTEHAGGVDHEAATMLSSGGQNHGSETLVHS